MKRRSSTELSKEEIVPSVKLGKETDSKKTKAVTVCITDPVKPNRLTSVKAIQSVLLWIYSEEQTNPMWIHIKNKSRIQHCVTLFVEVEGEILSQMVETGLLPGLAAHWSGKTKIEHRLQQLRISEEDPWDRLFSSTTPPRKIPKRVQDKPSFAEHVYQTYKSYTLSREELKYNLFPIEGTLTTNYVKTEENEATEDPLIGKILGMDCQMVTTTLGFQLAKITVVNFKMDKIYQTYVKPFNPVVDYNTRYSGITESILRGVTTRLIDVQRDLSKLISKNTILVGHSLQNDLRAIRFLHYLVIDTSILFRSQQGLKVSLKNLVNLYFKKHIQGGSHDSFEDAVNSLALAKLKIQILDKINLNQNPCNLDILQELLPANKQQIGIFTTLNQNNGVLKSYPVQIIHLQKSAVQSSLKQVKWYFKRDHPSKMIFDCIRRSGFESWQSYYQCLDQLLCELKNQVLKNSLVIMNFQMETNNKNIAGFKPFTLFIPI